MEESQLIELIKVLNQKDKEHILHFAGIPFFNQGRMRAQVRPLLEICFNHRLQEPELKLEKKALFSDIFPKEAFVEGKLEKVMVEAHRLIRYFLLSQRYFKDDNEFDQTFDFAEILRLYGLETRYQQLLTKLQKMQEGVAQKSASFFQHQFQLEYAIHEVECYNNLHKGDINIPEVLHALGIHYDLNRLALLNRYLLQQKFANLATPETIIPLLEGSTVPLVYLEESPALKVNLAIFNLLKKERPEPTDIRALFDLLLTNEANLDHASLREFYTYLRNICILVINKADVREELGLMLHDLYRDNLERGYLHYEGKLHTSTYWAVSTCALMVKKTDWALAFIEQYKHELIGENETQDIYRFNLANYLFAVGKFSECLDVLPDISPFANYLLIGKRLELKARYELRSDLLSFRLDAFRMHLDRTSVNVLSDSERQANIEFSNRLTQLLGVPPGNQKRIDKALKKIEQNNHASEWRWLISKAKELKGK